MFGVESQFVDMPVGCKHTGNVMFAFVVCECAVFSVMSFLILSLLLIHLMVSYNVQQHCGNSSFFCRPSISVNCK